jgi:hypothetical protein
LRSRSTPSSSSAGTSPSTADSPAGRRPASGPTPWTSSATSRARCAPRAPSSSGCSLPMHTFHPVLLSLYLPPIHFLHPCPLPPSRLSPPSLSITPSSLYLSDLEGQTAPAESRGGLRGGGPVHAGPGRHPHPNRPACPRRRCRTRRGLGSQMSSCGSGKAAAGVSSFADCP